MRRLAYILVAALLSAMLPSCRLVSAIVHDDEVVARVGKDKLYRVEVESVIPVGTPSEDSLNIARRYIDSWAADRVFLEAAAKSLSKKDQDVSGQLEQYRMALLKYRYEELFVNERLDTVVSDIEVKEYYDDNAERYELDFPIVKARFVRLSPNSPKLAEIKKLMPSSDEEKLLALEEIAADAAGKYTDFGSEWLDIRTLAEEFGTDYGTLLALMSHSTIQYVGDDGVLEYAYITDYMRAGSVPPVEFCAGRIRETIVNSRKLELMNSLERDLLEDARVNGNFVIY